MTSPPRPPLLTEGFAVFFTGLSAAGKSTTAEAVLPLLQARTSRSVTLLDGDVVRRTLWPQLGFSKADRDTNVRGLGRLAADVVKGGDIAICASIAPYRGVRDEVRAMIEPLGGFVLVHMATPLDVCERRDPKGLYARARAGLVAEFTGISDPYEPPEDAEVVVDASHGTPETSARRIVDYLTAHAYIR
ncbi:MAG: adenylyl-sulfate kinase [Candidatus Rokuibacteriota bacterium]